MNRPLRGIVFDLDGTLVDSLSLTFEAFQHALRSQGERVLTPAEIMQFFGRGENKIFEKIFNEAHGAAPRSEKAYLALIEYTEKNVHRMPLHAGVAELLAELKKLQIPMSIFTGRSWPTTEKILKHHDLMSHFVTVVADDHVSSPKPSPEGLLLALRRMKLEPSEVLMVGDSTTDMRAAKTAGAQGVAALWDLLAKREELAAFHPAYFAEKSGEVLEIWKRLA